MAAPDLTGRTISSTFGELLKTTNTAGITSALDTVVDGDGTASKLQISTAGVKSTGTLEATGATTLSTNLTLATGATVTGINDTDAFSDASATTLATSESVKAYADANVMGVSTFAVGDLLYASTTSALTKLVAGGTGNVLKISGGLPAWGAVSGTGTVTSVTGGNGLSGGEIVGAGTLAVDITNATDGTAITVDSANDELLVYDNDATAVKKITVSQLPGGGDTLPIVDGTAVVKDPADATKLVRIDAEAVATGTTRVITMGNRDVDLASGGTFLDSINGLTDLTNTTFGSDNFGAGDHIAVADASDSNNAKKVKFPVELGMACSDEATALTTGAAKLTFRMPHAMTLTEVRASVTTAPVGSTIIVDINDGGTTIMAATKLSIDASVKTSTTAAAAAVLSDTALADDAEITVDIDQIGSSTAGAGLKIWLIGYR